MNISVVTSTCSAGLDAACRAAVQAKIVGPYIQMLNLDTPQQKVPDKQLQGLVIIVDGSDPFSSALLKSWYREYVGNISRNGEEIRPWPVAVVLCRPYGPADKRVLKASFPGATDIYVHADFADNLALPMERVVRQVKRNG